MTPEDLFTVLSNAIIPSSGPNSPATIPLTASLIGGLGSVLTAVGVPNGQTLTLQLAAPTLPPLQPGATSVQLVGYINAPLTFLSTSSWQVTLIATPLATTNNVSLNFQWTGSDPITLGGLFPNLPLSWKSNTSDGTLSQVTSVLKALVVTDVRFGVSTPPDPTETPVLTTFSANLVIDSTSVLWPYAAYFDISSSDNTLSLVGTVNLNDPANPVLDLTAIAPGMKVTPLPKGSEITAPSAVSGLRLQSHYTDGMTFGSNEPNSVVLGYVQLGLPATLKNPSNTPPIISAPLLQGDYVWPLRLQFPDALSFSDGVGFLTSMFGNDRLSTSSFEFPPNLGRDLFYNFGIKQVQLGVIPNIGTTSLPTLSYLMLSFTSKQAWQPSLAFVKLRSIGTSWLVKFGSPPDVSGSVWGEFQFFGKSDATDGIKIAVSATIPDFLIGGETTEPITVPLGDVLQQYLGSDGGLEPTLTISKVSIDAAPLQQSFNAHILVKGPWNTTIRGINFGLDQIYADIGVDPNSIWGSITGWFSLATSSTDASKKAVFQVSAAYTQSQEWHFEGGLWAGKLQLLELVYALLGSSVSAPSEAASVTLDDLWISYTASGTDNPFYARGGLSVQWKPAGLSYPLGFSAHASISRRTIQTPGENVLALAHSTAVDGNTITEGSLSGTVKVNQLAITASTIFTTAGNIYCFEVEYGKLTLKATTRLINDDVQPTPPAPIKQHQVLAVSLSGMTVGSVVEYFVGLANPNANYQLAAPWTVLNQIPLSRFELTIDPQYQRIGFTYDAQLTLPFMKLNKIGIQLERSSGVPRVSFLVSADMLGKQYGTATQPPLSWDATNESPPAIPGQGQSLFSLEYLGIGQHVSVQGLTVANSVIDVLNTLESEMTPIADPRASPFLPSNIQFDPSSQWMLGLRCTLMDTVELGVVLHDSDLYGMAISLAGPSAKSLAGLSFELLYKKVAADIGVFHMRFEIPKAFRQIQLGAVSLTLGVITADIFTNGNFKIDLGFPQNRDFSTSFGVEVGPFMGRGGVYFGLLNGSTSRRVPAITNGTFDPVLELGVGLSLGVGRSLSFGPVTAQLSLAMTVIIEGVLAWFHPTNASAPSAMYFWVSGTAALTGTLVGAADFKVISAQVTIYVSASVTITFQSYRSTLVELCTTVTVHAVLETFFHDFDFSFNHTLYTSFWIGSDSAAPWALSSSQNRPSPEKLAANIAPVHRRRPAHISAITRRAYKQKLFRRRAPIKRVNAQELLAQPTPLSWPTTAVFPDQAVHSLVVLITGVPTIAQPNVQWPDKNPGGSAGNYQLAFTFSVAQDPNAVGSFETLIEAVLRAAIIAQDPDATTVSLGALAELAAQLDLPDTATQFTYDTISSFLSNNLLLTLIGPPTTQPTKVNSAIFPLPPPLSWTATGNQTTFPTVDFLKNTPIDDNYVKGANAFLASLSQRTYLDQIAAYFQGIRTGNATQAPPPVSSVPPESMAKYVFVDYFLLLAKCVIQTAIEVMESFAYQVTGDSTESLASICQPFSQASAQYVKGSLCSVEHVAAQLGFSDVELTRIDPHLQRRLNDASLGEEVDVSIAVTPESLVVANPDWTLVVGANPLPLQTLYYKVGSNELAGNTLSSIASAYGTDLNAWLSSTTLLQQPHLLQVGAPIAVPACVFTNNATNPLSLDTIAAVFYVRAATDEATPYLKSLETPFIDWFASAIADANQLGEGPLPTTLQVPMAYGAVVDEKLSTIPWTTLPGDSVWTIAASLALAQAPVPESPFATWLSAVNAANPSPSATIAIPAMNSTVLFGETLENLKNRFPIILPNCSDLDDSFVALVSGQAILAPVQQVTIPNCTYSNQDGDSFSTISNRFDLSLEEVGSRLAAVGGLLSVSKTQQFRIPAIPAMTIGGATPQPTDLVTAVKSNAAAIAAQVSRYMLSGLQLPYPIWSPQTKTYTATGSLTGLYALIGQQMAGLNPPATRPNEPTTQFTLTIDNPTNASWIGFSNTTVIANEEAGTESPVVTRDPRFARRTEGKGRIAITDSVTSLVVNITDQQLFDYSPPSTVKPTFDGAMSGYRSNVVSLPIEYGFSQRILWQTSETVALPGSADSKGTSLGSLGIWTFPGDLRNIAARPNGTDYGLYSASAQQGPGVPPVALTNYAWATMVTVRVATVPDAPEGTYQVLGVQGDGQQTLLDLWNYCNSDTGKADTYSIHVLTTTSLADAVSIGLSSTPSDITQTFLIQTNLSNISRTSTENVEEFATPDDAPVQNFFADLTTASQFVKLLWECAVVAGGGYWFRYSPGTGGVPLPISAFGAEGTAQLTFMILFGSQSTANPPNRKLYPCNNCAVVAQSIDPSSESLFARALDGSETMTVAGAQQGFAQFFVQTKAPTTTNAPNPTDLIGLQLYSMMGFDIDSSTSVFAPINLAFPSSTSITPQTLKATANDDSDWSYGQFIPTQPLAWNEISRGTSAPFFAPSVVGLPPPLCNPYLGIMSYSGTDSAPTLNLILSFRDVFGNNSSPSAGVSIPIYYTDALMGLNEWPATTSSYSVSGPGSNAACTLTVTTTILAATHVPDATQRATTAANVALEQLKSYSTLYYQLADCDYSTSMGTNPHPPVLTLTTTLCGTSDGPQSLNITPDSDLLEFPSQVCAWLYTTAQQCDVPPNWLNNGAATLEAVVSQFGTSYDAIAEANFAVACDAIFAPLPPTPVRGANFMVPQFQTFRDGDSLSILTTADPATIFLDPANVTLPLRTGVQLSVPDANSVTITVPTVDPSSTPSIVALLAAKTVLFETFIKTIADETAVLNPDFQFVCNGVTIAMPPADSNGESASLNDVANSFQEHGVPFTAVMVAGENADREGLFLPSATFSIPFYLTVEGDSFATLPASVGAASAVAALNATTTNIYWPGTSLYVGPSTIEITAELYAKSLEEMQEISGVPAGQLLAFNGSVPLASAPPTSTEPTLAVPGHATFRSSTGIGTAPSASDLAQLRVPYHVQLDQSWNQLATLFANADPTSDNPAVSLAEANANVAGILAADKSITLTLAGTNGTYTTGNDQSFVAFLQAAGGSGTGTELDSLVQAIGNDPTCLRTGALMFTPPAILSASENAYSPNTIAEQYGYSDFGLLAIANSALIGFIAASVELSITSWDGKTQWKITTGPFDTFHSLVERFAQQGLQTSFYEIVTANADVAFIAGGAAMLLPPKPGTLTGTVSIFGDDLFPSPIFPIETSVTITRDKNLVDPQLVTPPSSALTISSLIAPLTQAESNGLQGITTFVTQLETALPALRVAVSPNASNGTSAALSAVVFGQPNFVQSVAINPTQKTQSTPMAIPQYYALRPLYAAMNSTTTVPISNWTATGLLGKPQEIAFQMQDVETWAVRMLTDVELFLSAPYATAAYALGLSEQLGAVIAAKESLATSIASGLDYMLELGQTSNPAQQQPPPDDWTSATQAIGQTLLANLAIGYDTDAVVQYQATVKSGWITDVARLVGSFNVAQTSSASSDETTPAITIPSAKTSLMTSSSNFVNLLLTVAQDPQLPSVSLDGISYQVDQIEHAIETVVDGYEQSQWLQFVNPFASTPPPGVSIELGQPEVPLPVRTYPAVPSSVQHGALPTITDGAPWTPATLNTWIYQISFAQQLSSADSLLLRVVFNENAPPTEVSVAAPTPPTDLFGALAQYASVAQPLWTILQTLASASGADGSPADTTLNNAVTTFQQLVANVAAKWATHWTTDRTATTAEDPPTSSEVSCDFTITPITNVQTPGTFSALSLSTSQLPSVLTWPTMTLSVGGVKYELTQVNGNGDPTQQQQYNLPSNAPAISTEREILLELKFSNLSITTLQIASCSVSATRNSQLVEAYSTRSSLLCSTPMVSPTGPAAPQAIVSAPLASGDWNEDPAQNFLTTLCSTLFSNCTTPTLLALETVYSYAVPTANGEQSSSLALQMPVTYSPAFAFESDPSTGTVAQLINAVSNWMTSQSPATPGTLTVRATAISALPNNSNRTLIDAAIALAYPGD